MFFLFFFAGFTFDLEEGIDLLRSAHALFPDDQEVSRHSPSTRTTTQTQTTTHYTTNYNKLHTTQHHAESKLALIGEKLCSLVFKILYYFNLAVVINSTYSYSLLFLFSSLLHKTTNESCA